jgi:hypothetical protein
MDFETPAPLARILAKLTIEQLRVLHEEELYHAEIEDNFDMVEALTQELLRRGEEIER